MLVRPMLVLTAIAAIATYFAGRMQGIDDRWPTLAAAIAVCHACLVPSPLRRRGSNGTLSLIPAKRGHARACPPQRPIVPG